MGNIIHTGYTTTITGFDVRFIFTITITIKENNEEKLFRKASKGK